TCESIKDDFMIDRPCAQSVLDMASESDATQLNLGPAIEERRRHLQRAQWYSSAVFRPKFSLCLYCHRPDNSHCYRQRGRLLSPMSFRRFGRCSPCPLRSRTTNRIADVCAFCRLRLPAEHL